MNMLSINLMVENANGKSIDCTKIFDVWHIAMDLNSEAQDAVLSVWTQAHAMQDALLKIKDEAKG